jgi:hypothetical protein
MLGLTMFGDTPFLRSTRNQWALRWGMLLILAFGAPTFLIYMFPRERLVQVICAVGWLLGMGIFLTMLVGIRCARCGLRIVWFAATRYKSSEWFQKLTHLERCPRCAFSGVPAREQSSDGSVTPSRVFPGDTSSPGGSASAARRRDSHRES